MASVVGGLASDPHSALGASGSDYASVPGGSTPADPQAAGGHIFAYSGGDTLGGGGDSVGSGSSGQELLASGSGGGAGGADTVFSFDQGAATVVNNDPGGTTAIIATQNTETNGSVVITMNDGSHISFGGAGHTA